MHRHASTTHAKYCSFAQRFHWRRIHVLQDLFREHKGTRVPHSVLKSVHADRKHYLQLWDGLWALASFILFAAAVIGGIAVFKQTEHQQIREAMRFIPT